MVTSLKDVFLRNWIPKLTCLLVAIGLWFWVAIQQTGRTKYQVPLETVNTPENIFVTDKSTHQVTVTLEGPKTVLYRTSPSDIVATLNLAGQRSGTKVFWRSDLSIQKPQNLRIYDVSPQSIRMVLVRRGEKVVPVQARFKGALPAGFVSRKSVRPDTAHIVGSSKVIQPINKISLEPINLSNRGTGETTFSRKAQLPDGVNLKFPTENSFEVSLKVYERKITQTLKDVPVSVRGVPEGMQGVVEPPNISVTVKGPKTVISSLNAGDIDVFVSAPPPDSGLVIRVPSVNLPERVEITNSEQPTPPVKVKVEPK